MARAPGQPALKSLAPWDANSLDVGWLQVGHTWFLNVFDKLMVGKR